MSAVVGIGGVAATWATARMIAGPRAGSAGRPRACAVRRLVWRHVQSHQGRSVRRRHDGGDLLFCCAPRAICPIRGGATSPVRDPAGRGARPAGDRPPDGRISRCDDRPDRVDAAATATWRRFARLCARSLVRFIPALALGYVIMIASWPWASLDFFNPVRAIFAFAHFHYPIRTLLAGQVYSDERRAALVRARLSGDQVAARGPDRRRGGFAVGRIVGAREATAGHLPAPARLRTSRCLVFVIVFPLLCQIIGHGPSFTGMRHFLFVVPPLTALAGIGVAYRAFPMSKLRLAPRGCGARRRAGRLRLGCRALVRLHPYEYLFYNSLVGGLPGAARRYETDYWVNIMPAAVKDLEAYLDQTDRHAIRFGRRTTRSGSAASAYRSRTKPTAGCNGPPTGITPTSSSRPRT